MGAMSTPHSRATSADDLIAGIGWRHPHYVQVLEQLPRVAFLEVHSENFFAEGGAALATLLAAREHYPISLHGVGLGLGSAVGVDDWHVQQLKKLVDAVQPVRVSDHVCFGRGTHNQHAVHAADLLPIPFNEDALSVAVHNVQQVQEALGRSMLVENLSAYVHYGTDTMTEPAFLNALCAQAGCGLLLDVNNIYVNALNAQKRDTEVHPLEQSKQYVDAIAPDAVGQIHLAGHNAMDDIVIDDHGRRVCDDVWELYAYTIARLGRVPTLIEWDTDVPALEVLLDEAAQAERVACHALAGREAHDDG